MLDIITTKSKRRKSNRKHHNKVAHGFLFTLGAFF